MKNYFYPFLLLLCLTVGVHAQDAMPVQDTVAKTKTARDINWEIGLLAGVANAYGDLVDASLIQFKRTRIAVGGFVRYDINSNFAVRGSYQMAQLEGADSDWPSIAARGLTFESTMHEFAVVGQWYLGGYSKTNAGSFKPYLFAGLGLGFNSPDTDYSSIMGQPALDALIQQEMDNTKSTHLTVPFGLGAQIGFNDRISFSVEYGLRPVFNDFLDGVSAIGDPNNDDWYSVATLGLSYRLLGPDSDKDGIADYKDPCPNGWGPPENDGCPDSDADGVADHLDQCPKEAGFATTEGCPDQDQDGVPDYADRCPSIKGSKTANGCVDTDGDGVPDSIDECVSVFGSAEFAGCRDTDNDGIPDPKDNCPYEKGEEASSGCPTSDDNAPNADSDGDGVINSEDECPYLPGDPVLNGCQDGDKDGIADHKDRCPYEKGTAAYDGCPPSEDAVADTDGDGYPDPEDPCPDKAGDAGPCPDTDADGLTDEVDNCPGVAGPESRQGCPELSAEDAEVLANAIDQISFTQSSALLSSSSHAVLDRVAFIMKQYPSYHLAIEGHTDNQGDPDGNKRLSEQRAQACLNYLHEEGGIATERMTFVGYGGEQPRATNESNSGRRRNRRVEFKLTESGE